MNRNKHGDRDAFELTDDAPPRLKAVGEIDGHFYFDFVINEPLPLLRNIAAHNATMLDNYTMEDEPFYYGHIGIFGYVVAKKHLVKVKNESE